MIKIENLSKTYKIRKKKIHALKDLSLEIKDGEVFGLLGTNGAGKTTTIKILTTLLRASKGKAFIDGYDCAKDGEIIRREIGVVFANHMIYFRLTGRDNLKFFGTLYGIENLDERIDELAEFFEMTQFMDVLVEGYSNGMRAKLAIMRGLINDPKYVFLDEPTLGLDPNMALKVRMKISELEKRGKTIILTTHYMGEAEELCDRIGIMDKGELVAIDTPKSLRKKMPGRNFLEMEFDDITDINRLKKDFIVTREGNMAIVPIGDGQEINGVLNKILAKKVRIRDIKLIEPSLERVFAYYTEEKHEKV